MTEARLHDNRWLRLACLAVGLCALVLGLAGILLPVLPTTPFILLAAACFARSSLRFHGWLLEHRIAGPLIREWHEHRAMPLKAKRFAYVLMAISFGSSILIMESAWHRGLLALVGLTLLFFLWRVPVREIRAERESSPLSDPETGKIRP